MHQELDDSDAIVRKLPFELVDLAVGSLPRLFVAEALDPFDQDAAIPGAVENRPVAANRQPLPEAPEIVAPLFFGGRCADAPDMHRFGFEAVNHAADQATLACGVPAVDADDGSSARLQIVELHIEQPALQLPEVALVGLFLYWTVDHLDLVQSRPFSHRILPRGSCQRRRGRAMSAAESGTLTAPTATTTSSRQCPTLNRPSATR